MRPDAITTHPNIHLNTLYNKLGFRYQVQGEPVVQDEFLFYDVTQTFHFIPIYYCMIWNNKSQQQALLLKETVLYLSNYRNRLLFNLASFRKETKS